MSNYRTLQNKVRALRELGIKTPALNSKAEVLAQFLESVVSETTETEEKFIEETSVNTEVDNQQEKGYSGNVNSKGASNMVKPLGVILYEGKSAIDNETDIVVIATGLKTKTANPKTGDAIQTWILLRDEYPMEAINSGTDSAICGNCPHRKNPETGIRTCYVNPMTLGSVYKAYRKGNYPKYSRELHGHLFVNRKIRYGSYGEPVNIPMEIIAELSEFMVGHTGYTHQWEDDRFSEYRKYFMASVDSLMEFLEAKDKGWSTFRVVPQGGEITEVKCQGGVKTTCAKCLLCDGAETRQKHIAIHAHGSGSKYVK